jgi:hypothetical protein
MDKDAATRKMDHRVDQVQGFYEDHGKVFRALWIAVGVIVVLAGLAMTIFPGPVTIVVPAGLLMLAAVFGWARRLLRASVRKGVDAKNALENASPWVKVLGFVASACVGAAVIIFVFL